MMSGGFKDNLAWFASTGKLGVILFTLQQGISESVCSDAY